MAPSTIPTFYRIFFTIIDPILSLFGVVMHLQPTLILPNYSLTPLLPPSTETRLLLDALVGFFASLAFLQAVLLRLRPEDVVVWKVLQASTIFVDVAMVGAFGRALAATGRFGVGAWRMEEWMNVGINAFVGLVRICFVLSLGMRGDKRKRA